MTEKLLSGGRRKLSIPPDNVVHIGALRKNSAPYFMIWVLYYAWVVAFATWWTASPLTGDVFGENLRSMMHALNLLSSAGFILVLRREWFVRASRLGAALILAGMGVFFLAPGGPVRLAGALVSSAALGCVNISILIPFVFYLNNTEKLYAVVGSNALIQLISLARAVGSPPAQGGRVQALISLLLLAAGLGAVFFFRRTDLVGEKTGHEAGAFPARIYLTVVFNCIVAVLCKGAGQGVLNAAARSAPHGLLAWHYAGGLAGCVLFLGIYAFSRRAFLWLGNLTFASVTMGLVCNAFSGQLPGLNPVFAFLLGIGNTVGMINMYYIIGVVGKKYDSMRYLKLSIPLIGICGGVSGIGVGNLVSHAGIFGVSAAAALVSGVLMLVLMAFSPLMTNARFENDWAKDSQRTDTGLGELTLFETHRLTRRETQVCRLLLQGYTLRQISGILSIAYSTVNTYCTSAYRKLGVNSRTELLLLFQDKVLE